MAYESFTLELLVSRFGVRFAQDNDLYAKVSKKPASQLLEAFIAVG
jgi:hypothetical protein